MSGRAVFAIPGDPDRISGGFLYERRLLQGLRDQGRSVDLLRMPAAFPDPSPADVTAAIGMLRAVPPDLPVLLDGFLPGTMPADALRRLAAPTVAVVHHPLGLEAGLPPERAEWLLANERESLHAVRRVVVPSPFIARLLRERFGLEADAITVAPPGFDSLPDMAGTDLAGKVPQGPPIILSVGLLARRKGHDVLIDALARVADLEWRAVIVGGVHDARVQDDLLDRIARHGLNGRMALTGILNDEALAREWAGASVFALATRYEGYGIVFGEAMQRGLPIVAAGGGAVPETLRGVGLLAPPGDAEAFASALRSVLTDGHLRVRLGRNAAAAGRRLPSWTDTARIVGGVLDAFI